MNSDMKKRVIDALLNHVALMKQPQTENNQTMFTVGVDRARELDSALASLGVDTFSESDCQFLIQRLEDRIDSARQQTASAPANSSSTSDNDSKAAHPAVMELFSLLRTGHSYLAQLADSSLGEPTLCDKDFVRSFRQTGMLEIWTQLHQVLDACEDMNKDLTLDEFSHACSLLSASHDPAHSKYGGGQGDLTELCSYIQRCYHEEVEREAANREVDSGIELGKTAHYENQIKALFRVLGADGTNFNKIRLVMGIQEFFTDDEYSYEALSKGIFAWANQELPLRDRAGTVTGPDILMVCWYAIPHGTRMLCNKAW
jgi:hypothetical protein